MVENTTFVAKSMTAFGRSETDSELGRCSWELRSVNHRYLEASFKLPENFRRLEQKLKKRLSSRVARGKCEISLQYQRSIGELGTQVDSKIVTSVLEAQQQVQVIAEKAAPLTAQQLLNWPGVLVEKEVDQEKLEALLFEQFELALNQFVEARQDEGLRMAALIEERLQKIIVIVDDLTAQLPLLMEEYQQRLQTKLDELQVEVDADRLAQEMVLLAQKTDVAEELDRLKAHVEAVRDAMQKPEPCGRRLDFLMQELNREANTLGSKSISLANSNGAIELKVLIEQMREQVQNIE